MSPSAQNKRNYRRFNVVNSIFIMKFRAHVKRLHGWKDGSYIIVQTERRYGTTHYQLKQRAGYKTGWVQIGDLLQMYLAQS